jgi:putative addiction module component (TIGR02574 family)
MSTEEVFAAAESLAPTDKWVLMTKLWDSLPPEAWPAPRVEDIAEADRRLANLDAGGVQTIPGDQVRQWLRDRINRHG